MHFLSQKINEVQEPLYNDQKATYKEYIAIINTYFSNMNTQIYYVSTEKSQLYINDV